MKVRTVKTKLYIALCILIPVMLFSQSLGLDVRSELFGFSPGKQLSGSILSESWILTHSRDCHQAPDTSHTSLVYGSGDYGYLNVFAEYAPVTNSNLYFSFETSAYAGYNTFDKTVYYAEAQGDSSHLAYKELSLESKLNSLTGGLLTAATPAFSICLRDISFSKKSQLRSMYSTFSANYSIAEWKMKNTGSVNDGSSDKVRLELSEIINKNTFRYTVNYSNYALFHYLGNSSFEIISAGIDYKNFRLKGHLISGTFIPEVQYSADYSGFQLETGSAYDLISLEASRQYSGYNTVYNTLYFRMKKQFSTKKISAVLNTNINYFPQKFFSLFYSMADGDYKILEESGAMATRISLDLSYDFSLLKVYSENNFNYFYKYHLMNYHPEIAQSKTGFELNFFLFDHNMKVKTRSEIEIFSHLAYTDVYFEASVLQFIPVFETQGLYQFDSRFNAEIKARVQSLEFTYSVTNIFQSDIYVAVNALPISSFHSLVINWYWKN